MITSKMQKDAIRKLRLLDQHISLYTFLVKCFLLAPESYYE